MDSKAGEKHKHQGQETIMHVPSVLWLCLAPPYFSLYCQYKDYENKYKEVKYAQGNIDLKIFVISYLFYFSCILFHSFCIM